MDFDTTPVPPLQKDVTAESYANILKDYDYNPQSVWPSLSGYLKIDDEYRLFTFSLTEGIVQDIELTEIKKDDTFCGIPMHHRAKKFQKLLAAAGFESKIKYDGLDLTNHPVGFFIEGGKIATICWR